MSIRMLVPLLLVYILSSLISADNYWSVPPDILDIEGYLDLSTAPVWIEGQTEQLQWSNDNNTPVDLWLWQYKTTNGPVSLSTNISGGQFNWNCQPDERIFGLGTGITFYFKIAHPGWDPKGITIATSVFVNISNESGSASSSVSSITTVAISSSLNLPPASSSSIPTTTSASLTSTSSVPTQPIPLTKYSPTFVPGITSNPLSTPNPTLTSASNLPTSPAPTHVSTAQQSSTPYSNPNTSNSGLGVKLGVGIGVGAFIFITTAAMARFLIHRRKSDHRSRALTPDPWSPRGGQSGFQEVSQVGFDKAELQGAEGKEPGLSAKEGWSGGEKAELQGAGKGDGLLGGNGGAVGVELPG